ncbi:hypothetical protein GWK08_07155 [Leptobacterium flavescens]|uniref:Tetratricopeptide repeat protein n=1 Tax=Leptobacterium flavescens TaxID=472055 RepID=A0A6P0UIM8_9FLAO|nr:hypothetical protein [Leptobacterium flavescens]NER13211.1 hypothetical protein [Leptobacterium flavescens]
MIRKTRILLIILGIFIIPFYAFAQEEESAELTLEEYSDEFQENFFEALKQSGIENYDKAINYLLECKRLKPDNEVIDFELGKNYLKLNQFYKAEDYILKAVKAAPENIWYLEMLFEVYRHQNDTIKSIEIAKQLAARNVNYKQNLVMLYARTHDYEKALALLDELDKELGPSANRRIQRTHFTTLLRYNKSREESSNKPKISVSEELVNSNPLEIIKKRIEGLIAEEKYTELIKVTNDALEDYPSQSAFYYANGLAYNKTGKFEKAISSLEMALDFLLEDTKLENNIYQQLAFAHNALGNIEKSREYLKKGKKGS